MMGVEAGVSCTTPRQLRDATDQSSAQNVCTRLAWLDGIHRASGIGDDCRKYQVCQGCSIYQICQSWPKRKGISGVALH